MVLGGDLNPHAFRHAPLKRTCLPFHHPSNKGRRFCPRTIFSQGKSFRLMKFMSVRFFAVPTERIFMAYAVIKTGGKQYRVAEGDVIEVEKLDVESGKDTKFEEVLLVSNGSNLSIGAPLVAGAAVTAEVVGQEKAEKGHRFQIQTPQGLPSYGRSSPPGSPCSKSNPSPLNTGLWRIKKDKAVSRTGATASASAWASKSSAAKPSFPATSSCASAERSSSRARMSASAVTTPSSLWSKAA